MIKTIIIHKYIRFLEKFAIRSFKNEAKRKY